MKDLRQLHVKAVCWVLKQLQKHNLYTNLKKCQFYKDKIKFLSFIVLATGIKVKERKIEGIKDWLELKSVRDI